MAINMAEILTLARTAKEQAPEDPRISDTLGLGKKGRFSKVLTLEALAHDLLMPNRKI